MIHEFEPVGPPALTRIGLPEGDVDIRLGSVRVADEALSRLEETLSPAEHERAGRFRLARDRRGFIVARALLRRILADYLGIKAGEIEFRYSAAGKPLLAYPDCPVRFNLSHSGDFIMVAVAPGRDVGVDIEAIDEAGAHEDVAARFFHPGEAACLDSLRQAERRRAFYRFWTRKEAYLKARGAGLSAGLAALDVSALSGTPAQPVRFADPLSGDRWWWMFDLDMAPEFAAAAVVEAYL